MFMGYSFRPNQDASDYAEAAGTFVTFSLT
jgi:hypothetical protein